MKHRKKRTPTQCLYCTTFYILHYKRTFCSMKTVARIIQNTHVVTILIQWITTQTADSKNTLSVLPIECVHFDQLNKLAFFFFKEGYYFMTHRKKYTQCLYCTTFYILHHKRTFLFHENSRTYYSKHTCGENIQQCTWPAVCNTYTVH